MRTSKFITATAFISAVMLLSAGFAAAAPTNGPNTEGPKKVWVCHLEGHTSSTSWSGGGTTLTGDWVLNWNPAMLNGAPAQNQIDYCENPTGIRGGDAGTLILISVNALGDASDAQGHGAQLTNRISGYPDGYKG